MKEHLWAIWIYIRRAFLRTLDISDTTDKENTIANIRENIHIKGYNLWILACSALLASIGLDTNSSAVVIGAMLISPLMSPILGVGLGLAINDRAMFKNALKSLSAATSIALFFSTLYFVFTPLGEATSEILVRTKPTLLDVLVAFFGGVAGIVSSSRTEKTNAIPGVAIATALMPPLCTAGFGLAALNWTYFLGGFYLFFLNSVFISLSTYFVVKYLKFPITHYIDQQTEEKVYRWMTIFTIVTIAPSVYFLYTVIQKINHRKQVETVVIDDLSENKNEEILKWEIEDQDSVHVVDVFVSGDDISDSVKHSYAAELAGAGLDNYRVNITRVNMSPEEIQEYNSKLRREFFSAVEEQKQAHEKELARILEIQKEQKEDYQKSLSKLQSKDLAKITQEVKVIFPDIERLGLGQMVYNNKGRVDTLTTVHIQWKVNALKGGLFRRKEKMRQTANARLRKYFMVQMNKDTVVLVNP